MHLKFIAINNSISSEEDDWDNLSEESLPEYYVVSRDSLLAANDKIKNEVFNELTPFLANLPTLAAQSIMLNIDRLLSTELEKLYWHPARENTENSELVEQKRVLYEEVNSSLANDIAVNTKKLLKRFQDNFGRLHIFGITSDMSLKDITFTGSDFHEGHRTVLILTVGNSDPSQDKKIVYKPRDIRIDKLLGKDMPEFFNEKWKCMGKPNMPVYTFLSLLDEKDGSHFGFVEYLEHAKLKKGTKPFYIEDCLNNAKEHCILDTEEDQKLFFRQIGRWEAIAKIFRIGDLHQENVIVSHKTPYITDWEVSTISSQKHNSGLLRAIGPFIEGQYHETTSNQGRTYMPTGLVYSDSNFKQLHVLIQEEAKYGRRVSVQSPYYLDINDGYDEVIRTVRNPKFKSHVECFFNRIVTKSYQLRKLFMSTQRLKEIIDQEIELGPEYRDERIKEILKISSISPQIKHFFAQINEAIKTKDIPKTYCTPKEIEQYTLWFKTIQSTDEVVKFDM